MSICCLPCRSQSVRDEVEEKRMFGPLSGRPSYELTPVSPAVKDILIIAYAQKIRPAFPCRFREKPAAS